MKNVDGTIVLSAEMLSVMESRLKAANVTLLSVEATNMGNNAVAVKLGNGEQFLVNSLGMVFNFPDGTGYWSLGRDMNGCDILVGYTVEHANDGWTGTAKGFSADSTEGEIVVNYTLTADDEEGIDYVCNPEDLRVIS